MSVRVNLLPKEVKAKGQATRSRMLAGAGVLAVLAVLGALTLVQRNDISDAEARLATVEAENQGLQTDIAALQPFADLEARAQQSMDVVALAMSGEASMATVLQDLSAVLPPSAELTSVSMSFVPDGSAPAPGGSRVVYGRLAANGRVLAGVAPGVERLVIDLDRVAAFDNVYVSTSAVDEDGVVTFSLEVELGPEVLTERYGLRMEGAAS